MSVIIAQHIIQTIKIHVKFHIVVEFDVGSIPKLLCVNIRQQLFE